MAKYIVLEPDSIHIPGDERSRTHPGHGYPAEDRKITVVHKFDDEAALQSWLQRYDERRLDHLEVFRVEELELFRNVAFDLGLKGAS